MTWGDIGAIAGALVSLLTVLTTAGQKIWRRMNVRLERPDSGDRVVRPHRRPHRYPLLQPAFELDRQRGQLLVDMVRQTGLGPLQGFAHPSRLRAAVRWVKRNLFTFDADPKPAFAITGWRLDLDCDQEFPRLLRALDRLRAASRVGAGREPVSSAAFAQEGQEHRKEAGRHRPRRGPRRPDCVGEVPRRQCLRHRLPGQPAVNADVEFSLADGYVAIATLVMTSEPYDAAPSETDHN